MANENIWEGPGREIESNIGPSKGLNKPVDIGLIIDLKKVIATLVKPGSTFLDINCGRGDYVKAASLITKKLVCTDPDPQNIRDVVKLGFKGINAVRADATKNLPLRDKSVDSILLANILHGFVANKQDQKTLREILRVLRPEGRLGIVEFKETSPIGPPRHVRLSQNKIEEIMRAYKMVKIKYEDVGSFHFMLVFERVKLKFDKKDKKSGNNKFEKKEKSLPKTKITVKEKKMILPKVF